MIDPRTAPYAALLLRVTLGGVFLAHAALKLFLFTPAGTAKFFASLGVPAELAYVTMAAEILGGVALIAGFRTRIVALALTPILLGAIVLVHGSAGFFFNNPNGRLGVSRVLDRRARCPGAAGRRRLCARLLTQHRSESESRQRLIALGKTVNAKLRPPSCGLAPPGDAQMTMPSLFLSHGAPTLPLTDTPARTFLTGLGQHLPRPEGHSGGLGALGNQSPGDQCGRVERHDPRLLRLSSPAL